MRFSHIFLLKYDTIVTFIYIECIVLIARGETVTQQKRGEQSKDKNKVDSLKIISKKFKRVKNAREKRGREPEAGGGARARAQRAHTLRKREKEKC